MECYLDNAATTKPFDEVVDTVNETLRYCYANPSSKHILGFEAERCVENTREIIAKSLGAKKNEIIFTSGGTESNNQAIFMGVQNKKRLGNNIITTAIEHPSVIAPFEYLKNNGYNTTILNTDSLAHLDINDIRDKIKEDTILFSFILVNNELGSIQKADDIIKLIKDINKETLIHIDATQAYCKIPIDTRNLKADLISISGHKIHSTKGIGVLYVNERLKLKPYILGGGQEYGLRSGTLNVPAIAGLGVAVNKLCNASNYVSKLYELKEYFIKRLLENFEDISINAINLNKDLHSAVLDTAPQITSVSFSNIRAEVLLHSLEERGIYVSAGSACTSKKKGVNPVLKAIGLNDDLIESTVRFSFGYYTTIEQIDYTIEVLKEVVPILSKYRRR